MARRKAAAPAPDYLEPHPRARFVRRVLAAGIETEYSPPELAILEEFVNRPALDVRIDLRAIGKTCEPGTSLNCGISGPAGALQKLMQIVARSGRPIAIALEEQRKEEARVVRRNEQVNQLAKDTSEWIRKAINSTKPVAALAKVTGPQTVEVPAEYRAGGLEIGGVLTTKRVLGILGLRQGQQSNLSRSNLFHDKKSFKGVRGDVYTWKSVVKFAEEHGIGLDEWQS